MTIVMPQNILEERLRWVLPVVNNEKKLKDVLKVFTYSERTLKRWLAAYKSGKEKALTPLSTAPKTFKGETPIHIKERILEIRKKTKKCALKIHWQLEKEGIHIHERTIGKILKTEGMVRKYRVKKVTYKYLRAQRQPGELVS